jgi:hypothetical protein
MRPLGLSVVFLVGCASAGQPGPTGETDAAPPVRIDAAVKMDAAIADGPIPDSMLPSMCMSTMNCQGATMLGTVSGDQPSTKLMMTGYQSAWFRVRVTEDYSDFPGLALRVQSRLTSPAGVNFDTFVYVNPNIDLVECAATTGTVTMNGNVDQVRAEWGEGIIPNIFDDDRDVTIEVRPISGTCAPAAQWTLEVEGNWI